MRAYLEKEKNLWPWHKELLAKVHYSVQQQFLMQKLFECEWSGWKELVARQQEIIINADT